MPNHDPSRARPLNKAGKRRARQESKVDDDATACTEDATFYEFTAAEETKLLEGMLFRGERL